MGEGGECAFGGYSAETPSLELRLHAHADSQSTTMWDGGCLGGGLFTNIQDELKNPQHTFHKSGIHYVALM